MHVTKLALSSFFIVMSFTSMSLARDEDWGIFQFRKRLEGGHQVLVEYVRRDRGQLFDQKFMDLVRVSWGGKLANWTYLVGGAYVDFETGSDERRLHQFGIYSLNLENKLSGFLRVGFEQRSFIGDSSIYLRLRNRLQINLFPQYPFGLTAYDEIFYVPDGQAKFSTGFNENRLGLGLRFIVGDLEMYAFHTTGYVKTPKSSNRFEWLQLQTVFSF